MLRVLKELIIVWVDVWKCLSDSIPLLTNSERPLNYFFFLGGGGAGMINSTPKSSRFLGTLDLTGMHKLSAFFQAVLLAAPVGSHCLHHVLLHSLEGR